MDFDLFLAPARWEILKIIAKKPSSPIEIAKQLKTTVSYISQQLKLLDAAGLVIKKKTGEVEKGKPRTLFYLSNELAYINLLTRDLSSKKLLKLTDYHKAILKIWLLEDVSLHSQIEKLFLKLEENLKEIKAIFIESADKPRIIIITENKKLKTKIDSFIEKLERKIEYDLISENQLNKISPEFLISLYDPNALLKKLKGGQRKNV